MTCESFYNTFHYNKMYVTVEVRTRLFYKLTHHFTILGTEKDRKFISQLNQMVFFVVVEVFPPQIKKF